MALGVSGAPPKPCTCIDLVSIEPHFEYMYFLIRFSLYHALLSKELNWLIKSVWSMFCRRTYILSVSGGFPNRVGLSWELFGWFKPRFGNCTSVGGQGFHGFKSMFCDSALSVEKKEKTIIFPREIHICCSRSFDFFRNCIRFIVWMAFENRSRDWIWVVGSASSSGGNQVDGWPPASGIEVLLVASISWHRLRTEVFWKESLSLSLLENRFFFCFFEFSSYFKF